MAGLPIRRCRFAIASNFKPFFKQALEDADNVKNVIAARIDSQAILHTFVPALDGLVRFEPKPIPLRSWEVSWSAP
jgi:hypothetical protein